MAVLVLNASFEPLHVTTVRRAVVLLLNEKAEMLEAADAVLRSERLTMQAPLVIRLVTYIRVPRRWRLPVSRSTVLARDHYTCQYCGSRPGKSHLTLDHVLPRSRGGQKTWENLVAACVPCNRRKGGRQPHEAGMHLLSLPKAPRYIALVLVDAGARPAVWQKYIEPFLPRHPNRSGIGSAGA